MADCGANASASGCRFAAAIACLSIGAACASYRAAPLDGPFLADRLAPPSWAAVVGAASSIEHPIIQPAVIDTTDGLGPEEVGVVAVVLNPDLRAVRFRRDEARAGLRRAGLLSNPQFSGAYEVPRGDTTGAVNALSLAWTLDLDPILTLGADRAAARASLAVAELEVAWEEWRVAQLARLATIQVASLEQQAVLSADREATLASGLETLDQAADEQLVTSVERDAAEDAYRTARATRLSLELARDSAGIALRRLVGMPADYPLRLSVPAGSNGTESHEDPLDFADWSAGAESRRLDLAALRWGYAAQEETVRGAVLRQFPRINVGFSRNRDTGGILTLGGLVSIDLPLFDRNQGQIAAERATRGRLREEYVARLEDVNVEVAMLGAQIASVRFQHANATAAAANLRQLVERYAEAYRAGEGDVLTLYTARTELVDRELAVVQLAQTEAELLIGLEVAAGRYAPEAR